MERNASAICAPYVKLRLRVGEVLVIGEGEPPPQADSTTDIRLVGVSSKPASSTDSSSQASRASAFFFEEKKRRFSDLLL
jgi:hypothetical protein